MSASPGGSGVRSAAAGVVLLLGLFAVLCSVFGAVATYVDWRHDSPNVRTDLQMLVIFICAAAALIPLARFMAAREKRAIPVETPADGRHIGAGVLSFATGVYIIGMGTWQLVAATQPLTSENWMFVPAASLFLFAGVQLMLPPGRVALRHLFGALLMTAFAITFDWVAFGPGERHFTGGLSVGFLAIGLHSGEWLGRAVFGIPAVITTGVALLMWFRWR